MTFLDGCINQYNFATVCCRNNLVLFAVKLINYIVGIDCKRAFNYNILCRHCSGSLAPTTKGVAFLDWCINQYNFATVCYRNNLVLFAVKLINYIVGIDCKRAFNYNILCRHCSGSLAPTTKGVAFLDWCINQYNFATVCCRNNLVLCAINLVDYIISIHCKRTFDCYIVCRHCGRCFAPTAKGVSFLNRCINQYNLATVCCRNNLVLFAVNLINYIVGIYSKRTFYCYIVCRHSGWRFAPSAEGVTFLDGCINQYNFATVCCRNNLVLFAINLINYIVCIDCKRAFNYNILGRHSGWRFAPTAEAMTFLDWGFNHYNFATINYRNNLVLFTINLVDYIVSIDCKRAFYDNILGRHCSRCFTPSAESVTLPNWSLN